MRRLLPLAAIFVAATLLTGCVPRTPEPTTETPRPSTTVASTPTPSATPTSTPPPTPIDPLAGTCDELLAPTQIAALFSPAATSLGDTTAAGGGRGSTDPIITALMPAGGRHCTWVIPDTENGLVVSVLRADAATRAAVDAATGLYSRDSQPGVRYLTFAALDSFTFTETQALGEGATDLWVAVYTDRSNSRDIAEVVWTSLVGP